MRRITAVALSALLLGGAATACGDDASDDAQAENARTEATAGQTAGSSTSTTVASATTAPATSAAPTGAKAGVITAFDYGYSGVQKTYAPGTVLHMTNTSRAEVHEMVVFRLPDNETRSATALMALPREQLEAVFAGPPTAVIVAPPTLDGFPVVGDGSVTKPGRYIAFCSIPTGANPSEYMAAAAAAKGGEVKVAGGPPHFVKGMVTEFSVGS